MAAGPSTGDLPLPVILFKRYVQHDLVAHNLKPGTNGRTYVNLVPEEHGIRYWEDQEDEAITTNLDHHYGMAVALARLPEEPWWERLLAFIKRQPVDDDVEDPHQADQWIKLINLMHFHADAFGAEKLEAIKALQNVLLINECTGEDWPAGLGSVLVAPRLDRPLNRPVSIRGTDAWVAEGDATTHTILHPCLRSVGYSSVYKPPVGPSSVQIEDVTNEAAAQVQQSPMPLALRKAKRNKPGKAMRERRRASLAVTVASTPLETQAVGTATADSGPAEAPQQKVGHSGPPSNNSSSTSNSSESSSGSDPDESDSAGANVPLPAAVPTGDAPFVLLPLGSRVVFPPLPSSSGRGRNNSFSFPSLPAVTHSFASLFSGGQQPVPVSVHMNLAPPVASLPANRAPLAPFQQAIGQPSLPANRGPASAHGPASVQSSGLPQPAAANVPPVHTSAPSLVQISVSNTSSGVPTGATAVAKVKAALLSDPTALSVACKWLSGLQNRRDKPATLRQLSDDNLDQLQEELAEWVTAFTPAVSPPSVPVASVHQGQSEQSQGSPQPQAAMQPPAPAMQQPAPVQLPALAAQQPALAVPVQAAPQIAQAIVRGSSRIRLPPLQHFSGDMNSAKPKVILTWLRQMQLALQQDSSTDPVSIAVMHLDGNAASWRDTTFLPAHTGPIPWHIFETALKDRFMDRVACMDALREFRSLSMRSKQSVQDFNDLFVQRRMELALLPYISVPDEEAQVGIYLGGLRADIAGTTQEYADVNQLHSLTYWMQRAVTIEAVHETRRMRESASKKSDADL